MNHIAQCTISDVLQHYGITSEQGLADCGCGGGSTGANLDLLFPLKCTAEWVTVRANTDVLAPTFNLEQEIAAVLALGENERTKLALMSNINILNKNYFSIEHVEFAGFDSGNSMAANWLMNYFQPQIIVKDTRLTRGAGELPNGKPNTSGLGKTLPNCLSFNSPFTPLQTSDNIRIIAELRKKDAQNVLRHLPLKVTAVFQYRP